MPPQLTTVVCPLSGVWFRDQILRENILQELLVRENIAPRKRHPWYRGGTDRAFLEYIWQGYCRSVSADYLTQLVQNYHSQYQQKLATLPELPWYPETQAFLQQAQAYGYQLGLQTEQNWQALIADQLPIKFAIADYGGLVNPEQTLVMESTQMGIQRARAVGCWVVGVAQQMPYHWVHRHAHWVVDTLKDWDWEQVLPPLAVPLNPPD